MERFGSCSSRSDYSVFPRNFPKTATLPTPTLRCALQIPKIEENSMNRLASVLAGGVTAAVSGAVIAAAAVGQGVFDSPSKAQPKQEQAVAATTWSNDPTAAATAAEPAAAQAVQPRILYVDKEPVVVTQTYQQPVAGAAALSTETASPTSPPTKTPASPTVAATPKPDNTLVEPSAPDPRVEPRVQQLPPVADNGPGPTRPAEKPQNTASTNTAPPTAAPTQPPAPPTSTSTTPTRPSEDDHRTTTTTTTTNTGGGQHGHDD
jgi:hypothetical protein